MTIFSLLLEKCEDDYYYRHISDNIIYYIPSYNANRLDSPLSNFKSSVDYTSLVAFLDNVYTKGEYSKDYVIRDSQNTKDISVTILGYCYKTFLILVGSPKPDKLLEETLFKEDYIFLVKWVRNKDEHIDNISENVITLLGYTKEEILSKHYVEFVHPEDTLNFKKELAENISLDTSSFYQRYRLITKSGKSICILDHTCLVVKEDTKAMIGYLRDITLENERSTQLKELISLDEEDFNSSILIKIEWDSDYKIVRWNTEAENVLGWDSTILGKHLREISLFSSADSINIQGQFKRLFSHEILNVISNFKVQKKDGSFVDTKWSNKLITRGGKFKICSSIIDQSQEMILTNRLDEMEGRTDLLLKTLENTQLSNDVFSKLIHNPLTSNPEGLIKAEIIIRKLEEEIGRLNNTVFYNNDNNLINDIAFLKNEDNYFREKLSKVEEKNSKLTKELEDLLNINILNIFKKANTQNIVIFIVIGYILFGQLMPAIYPTVIRPIITQINKELKQVGVND